MRKFIFLLILFVIVILISRSCIKSNPSATCRDIKDGSTVIAYGDEFLKLKTDDTIYVEKGTLGLYLVSNANSNESIKVVIVEKFR